MKEEKPSLTINGKNEQEFLAAYHHAYKSVEEIGLQWKSLVELYDHYCKYVKDDLELKAPQLHEEMLKIKGAYIVKYRVKDPEHLVDKAIRKRADKDDGRIITKENYLDEIDDFIGLRILHLFKNEWEPVCKSILEKFKLKEKPKAYYREGDSKEYIERCKELEFELKTKTAGYRSIHFIANVPFFGREFKCEIQVRTIFEDAWSEIDHLVRYPNNTDNELLNNYLLMFNSLAAQADDMGTFLIAMKTSLAAMQKERDEMLSEIESLRGTNAEKNKKIDELKKKLDKSTLIGWPYMPENPMQSTLDYVASIQNPSGSTFSNPYMSIQESIEDSMKQLDLETLRKTFEGPLGEFKMPKVGEPMSNLYDMYPWLKDGKKK